MDRLPFEWLGEDPSADFVNTVSWGSGADERLRGYADVLDWAEEGKLVEEPGALRRAAARDANAAAAAFADAIALRARLHDVFAALAAGKKPAAAAVADLDRWAADAASRRRLEGSDATLRWRWDDGRDLRAPLRRVAHAAAALLTSDDATRIKLCANASCGWVFVDRSRRGNRRWCEMSECGSRDKARRYYQRHHAAGGRDQRR